MVLRSKWVNKEKCVEVALSKHLSAGHKHAPQERERGGVLAQTGGGFLEEVILVGLPGSRGQKPRGERGQYGQGHGGEK